MTQREIKVPYNSALANRYGQEAYDWCGRYGVGKHVTFSLAKYTEAGAMWLAQLWADRMDYFFHLALEPGQLLTYIYEADAIEDAPGPAPELLAIEDSLPLDHPFHEAFRRLRDQVPR